MYGGGKLPGPSPGIFSGKTKFAPITIVPQDYYPMGQNSLQRQNSLQCANCIFPFQHFTIDGNVSPKKRFSIGNFTISPLHHNGFTIAPYMRKILIHHYTLWKTKNIAPFSPETILIHSNHSTILTLHHIMISKFHHFTGVLQM